LLLFQYGAEAKSAVPSLIKFLEECTTAMDPHEDIFETAISALDQIGTPASSALPVLSRIANDRTGRLSTLRIKAEDAILEIEGKVLALEEKQ
jgi:hypothetical protein